MITNSELLDAIASAITANAALFLPDDAGEGTTAEDFVISSTHPFCHACLLSAPDFIADCVIGEESGSDPNYITARDITRGWAKEAEMPTYEQIRDYVSACDMNGNFQAIIDAFPETFEA